MAFDLCSFCLRVVWIRDWHKCTEIKELNWYEGTIVG